MQNDRRPDLETFLEELGFSGPLSDRLKQAFVHPTYALEAKKAKEDNQRLEFLGDAVLALEVARLLYESYPGKQEGELSAIRATAVSESSLASLAQALNLGDFLLLGKGEEASGGRYRASSLADLFEAFVAGLYLDYPEDKVRNFIASLFRPLLKDIISRGYKDAKTALQEWVQDRYKETVSYRLLEEEGPDHDKIFTCGVIFQEDIISIGRGKNKKEAQRKAAATALEYFQTR